jgi:hypothetical protein
MIIFFEAGRLGNQLFQYCGLKKIDPSGQIYIYGMNELKRYFCGLSITKSNRLLDYLIRRIGKKRFKIISEKYKLIGFIKEVGGTYHFEKQQGFLKNVFYCDTAYFQSENLINHTISEKLTLLPKIKKNGEEIIAIKTSNAKNPIFVHIRRTDFLRFPSLEAPAVLTLDFYQYCMNFMKEKYKDPYFIIMSDDLSWAKENFSNQADIFISSESEAIDFSIMTQCRGGILSASSFAWWGAYFSKINNPNGIFLAPKFWLGHPQQKWIPIDSKAHWIHYVDTRTKDIETPHEKNHTFPNQ